MSEPKFKKGDPVTTTADHMKGMDGMSGTISAVHNGPFYAVSFDKPMEGMKNPHKWLAESELKAMSGEGMEMEEEESIESILSKRKKR